MRALICDDEPDVLNTLGKMLSEQEPGAQVETYTSGAALLKALADHHGDADVVFLDIVFSGEEEIGIGTHLRKKYPELPIVFITGHLEYAPDIFEADPAYLLAKPFHSGKLSQALAAVRRRTAAYEDSVIAVPLRGALCTLRTSDIEYIESKGRKVAIYGSFEPIEYYGKLSRILEDLPDNFARCHQSFIVNMDRVTSLGTADITMLSGQVIPVAQRRRNAFREQFVTYRTLVGIYDQ